MINRTLINSQSILDEDEDEATEVTEIITPAARQAKSEMTTLAGHGKFISPYSLKHKLKHTKVNHI